MSLSCVACNVCGDTSTSKEETPPKSETGLCAMSQTEGKMRAHVASGIYGDQADCGLVESASSPPVDQATT